MHQYIQRNINKLIRITITITTRTIRIIISDNNNYISIPGKAEAYDSITRMVSCIRTCSADIIAWVGPASIHAIGTRDMVSKCHALGPYVEKMEDV